jgi:DNA-binding NtrC family response regulator
MGSANILVVDDELIMRESLSGWLKRDGHTVHSAASGEEALTLIEKKHFDIMLVDIKMEGISGLEVLKKVRETDGDAAVVMITAYGSVATAIEAMKNGATDYLLKPFDPNELGVIVEKVITRQAEIRENQYLKARHQDRMRFESLIGQSAVMQSVFDMICSVAPQDSTVLITGETGTGKGLAAKALHTQSRRAGGPFVTVNCGAMPEHLMETELFGYQKGAFTDAKETKKGRLELAHGGTLFLDEIGEIGMRMQIDLLRVLEDGVFYRVGGTQPLQADFRVVAATNRDLKEAIREGTFRQDLFYRLNVITLEMPALRKRKEDIPLLAEHFLCRFAQETNKPMDNISRAALDEMMLYEWPGNVRELENAMERAVVINRSRVIEPKHLPILCSPFPDYPSSGSLKEMEKSHILRVLEENRWNISRCARILGIDRSTLYKKMERYGLRNSQ